MLGLAVLLLFLYAVVPQVAGLGKSFDVVMNADLRFIALAFLCWAVIYILAVVMYMILALYPLSFRRTLTAQVASGFTGKLLPSGLGVVGLYVQYLRKCKHTLGEAVAVASVNNLAAVIGHICLIIGFLLAGTPLPELDLERMAPSRLTLLAVVAVVAALAALGVLLRAKLRAFWNSVLKTLRVYREHPGKIVAAVLWSIPQTFAYIGVLYFSMVALGLELDIRALFMVATFSMLAGTLIPVPGGIVGAEAGMTAAFMAYGFSFQDGLTVALLYRAFIYWLPILPGAVTFAFRRRDYL